jgi:tetratricopeptide (TPR) repeat protein
MSEDSDQPVHAEIVYGNKVGGDIVGGDKFADIDIQDSEAVAIGAGAQATVNKTINKIMNIDIRLLPLVIGLIVAVGVLSYFLFRTDIPTTMDAEFNVAVAQFTVLDERGNPVKSDEGVRFANWLYGRVNRGLSETLGEIFEGTYLVWPPEYTGVVSGATPAEREANAAALADRIGADFVIYGVLSPLGDNQLTNIEFYVTHDSFSQGADITGQHNLGDSLPIGKPFNESLVSVQNQPLSARAQGLSLIAVGLAYYAIDDFESAIRYFETADRDPGWMNVRVTGKHVLKLLLGNAHVRQASKEKSPARLPVAERYYTTALSIDSEYARAEVGRASVIYLMALGDPQSGIQMDSNLLREAEQAFQNGLTLTNAPASAHIETKVQFGLGQIYLVRFAIDGGDWLTESKKKFEAVISDFEAGNEAIADLASHAYARLGLIKEWLEDDIPGALAMYELAVRYTSPFYQAEYRAKMGDLYTEICEIEQARVAYQEARNYALQNLDEASFSRYSEKLSDLARSSCP